MIDPLALAEEIEKLSAHGAASIPDGWMIYRTQSEWDAIVAALRLGAALRDGVLADMGGFDECVCGEVVPKGVHPAAVEHHSTCAWNKFVKACK